MKAGGRSVKYLVGESYGCTRAAVAAGIAANDGPERSYEMAFDGLCFIGNTVTVATYFNRHPPVDTSVLAFTTMAAINWYHKRPTKQSLGGCCRRSSSSSLPLNISLPYIRVKIW